MKKKQEKIGKHHICPICREPIKGFLNSIWLGYIPSGFFSYEIAYPEYKGFHMHTECHEKLQSQAKKEIEMRKHGIFPELLQWKCEYCQAINDSKSAPNFCSNCGSPRKK